MLAGTMPRLILSYISIYPMCRLIRVFTGRTFSFVENTPVSILHKSIAGRYRPVRVADGPITTRCRFIKNASWDFASSHIVLYILYRDPFSSRVYGNNV